jgi:hypothetical protein
MNRRLLYPTLLPMAAFVALSLAACTRHAPNSVQPANSATSSCLPSHDGYLRVRLRGARDLDVDWHDADLTCEGGERPGQGGLRLAFAGPVTSGGHRLRFVFGVATPPGIASTREVPTNVTVIFEGENGLYSTRGDDKCTIDELTQAPMIARDTSHAVSTASTASSPAGMVRVSGRGFCASPATAIDDTDALLLSRFDFAGLVVDAATADHPQ